MINNLLNSTLNRASFALSDSKDQILAASKKRAQEQFDFEIPSVESFKNKLSSLPPEDPKIISQAQQIYNESKNILEKAIKRLENSQQELIAIKTKVIGVNEKFTFFKELTVAPDSVFGFLVDFLRTLPTTIDLILASQVTPVVSGTVIDKAGEFKDAIKNSVNNFDNGLKTLPSSIEFFEKETNLLLVPLDTGIENIQKIIDQLQILLDQLNKIFANYLLSSNLPELNQNSTTGDQDSNTPLSNTTLEEYLSNPNNLSNVVETLIIPTETIYYERTDSGPGTEVRETGIIEVRKNAPID